MFQNEFDFSPLGEFDFSPLDEFDFSPLDIPDMLGKVNYCPICGAAMVRRTEFFDIGMHTESISFYECPRCGETR